MRKFILLTATAGVFISADCRPAAAQYPAALGRNPYVVYCDTLVQAHPTRAVIVVIAPPDADLFLNDVLLQQKGLLRRQFVSPVLEPFANYTYELKVQRYADGKPLPPQVKPISVGAGRITWEYLSGPYVEPAPAPRSKEKDEDKDKKKL
jgi:uncharacterized protein (TIGR03000 family)